MASLEKEIISLVESEMLEILIKEKSFSPNEAMKLVIKQRPKQKSRLKRLVKEFPAVAERLKNG